MNTSIIIIIVLLISAVFTNIAMLPCYHIIGFYGMLSYIIMTLIGLTITISIVHVSEKIINREHLD